MSARHAVLLDTAVFIYAVGGEHRYREACRDLLDPTVLRRCGAEASVQAVQEFLHQRARRTGDRQGAADLAEAMSRLCPLHDLTPHDLRVGLQLFRQHDRLTGRDALHAATALNRDIPAIISPDPDFDGIDGLTRIDPLDAHERFAS